MKGIVVEIHNPYVAVLSEEGLVMKIRNNQYQIGQEVTLPMNTNKNITRFYVIAAAASIVIFIAMGTHLYFTPYSYVSLDVNPSIEYTLNRFNKVLSAQGVNDDGSAILTEISLDELQYADIEDAITITMEELSAEGYFDDEDSEIFLTTASEDTSQTDALASDLSEVANDFAKQNEQSIHVTSQAIGKDKVEEAKELGVTPGKLTLVEKLIEASGSDEDINVTEWLQKSVKEITAQTNLYREQNKEQEMNMGEEPQNQEQNANEEKNGEPAQSQPQNNQPADAGNTNSNRPEDPGSTNSNRPEDPGSSEPDETESNDSHGNESNNSPGASSNRNDNSGSTTGNATDNAGQGNGAR